MQKIHAGLYRYKSKAEIDRLFDSRRALLKDSLDEMYFFRIMRSIIGGKYKSNMSMDLQEI